MKITYDAKYDALYLKFADGSPEVTTQRISDDIALDFDGAGRIVGIEILSASRHLDLGDLLPVSVQKR